MQMPPKIQENVQPKSKVQLVYVRSAYLATVRLGQFRTGHDWLGLPPKIQENVPTRNLGQVSLGKLKLGQANNGTVTL